MKKALVFMLLLALVLTGCRSVPAVPAERHPLTAASQYDLTAYPLPSGLTPTGQACLSGDSLYFLASAPTASPDSEHDVLQTRLCRAELTSGKTHFLTDYASGAAEDAESFSSVAALLPAPDGGVWVMENTTHYIFDLPKNFDEALQDKWEYYQYRGDSTVLRLLDAGGTETASFTMTNLQSSLTAAAAAGDYLLCAQGESILVLTQEGALTATVPVPAWVTALAVTEDTVLVLTEHEDGGSRLYTLNLQDFSLTETAALPVSVYAVSGVTGSQLRFTERGNLFSWNTAEAAGQKLLDWQDHGRDRSCVSSLFVTDDGAVAALYQQSPGEALELLVLTPSEAAAPEYHLTLGVLYPDEGTMELVLDFNQKNNGGKIRVLDYSEYEVLGQNGKAQLRIDLAAGEGPDLLFSADWSEPVTALAEHMLTDLSPYLQKDNGLMSQGLMTSVFDALREKDGSLYTVASSFLLSTAMGREDIVSPTPVTVSRVNLLCQSVEQDGLSPMELYTTRENAMQGHLQRHWSTYFSSGSFDLEQETFTQGLNFVRLYPQSLDWNTAAEEWIRVRRGTQLYLSGSYMSFQALAGDMSAAGENAVLCGWPDTPGGHALEVWESWGMLTSCRDRDLAWRFLRQVLTEEYQTSTQLMGLPTNRSAFRRLGQAAMQGGDTTFRPMGEEMVEISTRLTQKQYDAIEAAAESAVTLSRPVPENLAQAICQAASEYLDGEGDAADAVRSAQFAALAVLRPETATVETPESMGE